MTAVTLSPTAHGSLRSWRRVVALVAVVTMLIIANAFLVRVFVVPSVSMEPDLQPGDRLVVDETVPHWRSLHRGDVVVFRDPGGWVDQNDLFADSKGTGLATRSPLQLVLSNLGLPGSGDTYLVKRVIGLPGDRIESDANGRVRVDGRIISEPYLRSGDSGSRMAFSVTVPAGHLWVMGDNRGASADSRYQQHTPSHGFVPVGNVVGRVAGVVWPLSRARTGG